MASVSSPDGQAAQVGTSSVNPWAAFDEMSVTLPEVAPFSIGKLAFYGRCSTEDNQDPATSLDWQVRAANALVEIGRAHV